MSIRGFRDSLTACLTASLCLWFASFSVAEEPIVHFLDESDYTFFLDELDQRNDNIDGALRLVGNSSKAKSSPGKGGKGGCDCCINGRHWMSADYLMWWTKGMEIPPLVTTTTVDPPVLGVEDGSLDQAGTVILFGNEEILEGMRSGLRFQAGMWLDDCCRLGLEADYYFLNEDSERFSATSDGMVGSQVISRPFYDIIRPGANPPAPGVPGPIGNIEQVAFPNMLGGTITVTANTEFQSGGVSTLR